MRVLVIGDTHGTEYWKHILLKELSSVDKVVFIGDYFDSHENISAADQETNFKDIIKIKEHESEKIVLLAGNHDLHYILHEVHYSGYQWAAADNIRVLLKNHSESLQAAVEFDKVLYTHAGVTAEWQWDTGAYSVADLNNLYRSTPSVYDFRTWGPRTVTRIPVSPYGDNIWQGPMWVRPNSLMRDPGELKEGSTLYTPSQVVGHTHSKEIILRTDGVKFAFVDALPHEYLIVDDGKFIVKKLYGEETKTET